MNSSDSEVVILGHSFVVKLQRYPHSEWENLKLGPSQVRGSCMGGGDINDNNVLLNITVD